ncbi:Uncharacterized protein TCAP_01184 [Tolypocladium capitatum]|uniref:Uncharacterized protein n=1 Tax=Tolypocladium capitatum TaxID=45235 RepID=A0A2K3QMY8_9HYPO|nr:Uncharacterized protein TCAP_01184 [Tolypocladium capitatum]
MAYGISLTAYCLWPNLDSPTFDPDALDTSILAINLDVQAGFTGAVVPPVSRDSKMDLGAELVRATLADDAGPHNGFVFAQLGSLCVLAADWERLKDMSASEIRGLSWRETGFGVVVAIDPFGTPDSVWVIYKFYEDVDEYSDDDEDEALLNDIKRIETEDDNGRPLSHIGRLHRGCSQRVTVAKVADGLGALKTPRCSFDFHINKATECQIVRAKSFTPRGLTMVAPQYIANHTGTNGWGY